MAIDLPVVAYRLTFRPSSDVTLPAFLSGFWRSVLGRAFKIMARLEQIAPANPSAAGAFERHFGDGGRKAYVIRAPMAEARCTWPAGSPLPLELVLIGETAAEAPIFLQGFTLAGELGIGSERAEAALDSVLVRTPLMPDWQPALFDADGLRVSLPATPPLDEAPEEVLLELWSPLTLKRDGKLLPPDRLEASTWLRNLIRRVLDLAGGHGGHDHRALEALCDHARFCDGAFTQVRRERIGHDNYLKDDQGIIGNALLDLGPGADQLWPFLQLAPWVHVGRWTTMGGGGVRLHLSDGQIIA